MNVFIVYANERAASFNAALKDTAVRVFGERGDPVEVSDLYAMGFKAVADRTDFLEVSAEDLPYQVAQNAAAQKQLLCPEIKAEVDKLFWADLLIFHFPLWWFAVPAILKGWIDRVLINGLMYSRGNWYGNGTFKGKHALATLTTGAPQTAYGRTGINGDLEHLLFPIQHGVFHFLGMDTIDPFIVHGSAYISQTQREEKLLAYERKLSGIENASRTPPPDTGRYDHGTWQLIMGSE